MAGEDFQIVVRAISAAAVSATSVVRLQPQHIVMEGVFDMTLDEAIQALSDLRNQLGGSTPLLMADGLPVARFGAGDNAYLLAEIEKAGQWDHGITYRRHVSVCDVPECEDAELLDGQGT
jgi:hypothetical protein